jgi:hypothetical protein
MLILIFSCNSKETRKESVNSRANQDSNTKQITTPNESKKQEITVDSDTTSSDYLIYLVKSDKALNFYWTKTLDSLQALLLPQDPTGHLSIVRNWQINDTISVIILSSTGGTYYDEFLLSIKNKHDIISEIQIGDNTDSDLSPENPYFYTRYEISDDRRIKLFNHKIIETEGGSEKDRIISIETWTIQNNGKVIRK